MTRKHYKVDEVIRSLSSKKDIEIKEDTRTVFILNDYATNKANDIGNKSWGKIDFLTNYHGYRVVRVPSFKKQR